jgi:CBS-domain-containing membrane protein
LQYLITNFLTFGIHRAPVEDENRKLVGLVAQSDVIGFLHTNESKFRTMVILFIPTFVK